jgi:hypothetical protein
LWKPRRGWPPSTTRWQIFHIRYDEAVTDAKESGEKLATLIERVCKDQEEAQKVKSEHDELL